MPTNLASHTDQRVAIFIDTQNLYHSAKANYRANVNYEELVRKAVGDRKLVRAFAYVIKSEESTEEKFFGALEEIGIETRVKDLQIFHTGAKKADWDVGIAVDMIRLTEKVDVIVLASGDGDFLEVVRFCQSRGVRVELMAFEQTTNAKIKDEVDLFTDLGGNDSDFLIGSRKKGRSSKPYSGSYTAPAPTVKPTGYIEARFGEAGTGIATPDQYSGSNLSSVNRMSGNANQRVSPSIFGRPNVRRTNAAPKDRKVRPVVGLPAAPANSVFGQKPLVNDQTKKIPSVNNAFGNKEPRRKFFR